MNKYKILVIALWLICLIFAFFSTNINILKINYIIAVMNIIILLVINE